MFLRYALKFLSLIFPNRLPVRKPYPDLLFDIPPSSAIGLIAGNGDFPLLFAKRGKEAGHKIFSVCHFNETTENLIPHTDDYVWIKVGELGKILDFFQRSQVKYVVMAGGISRIKHFGDIKLDLKGSMLMMRLQSTKDDVVMRGIAEEIESLGMKVIPCTSLCSELITDEGILVGGNLTKEEQDDVDVGIRAIKAMSTEDIGQTVLVREGIVIAVEAVEGTNQAIKRGGELAKKGVVVVKCAKPTQDMRFDVPTAGPETIRVCKESGVSVLALEAGRSIIMDKEQFLSVAKENGIKIVGIPSLVQV